MSPGTYHHWMAPKTWQQVFTASVATGVPRSQPYREELGWDGKGGCPICNRCTTRSLCTTPLRNGVDFQENLCQGRSNSLPNRCWYTNSSSPKVYFSNRQVHARKTGMLISLHLSDTSWRWQEYFWYACCTTLLQKFKRSTFCFSVLLRFSLKLKRSSKEPSVITCDKGSKADRKKNLTLSNLWGQATGF